MEKYARQAMAEGIKNAEDIIVTNDSELYRVLNLHYNRNNQIEVTLMDFLLGVSLFSRHRVSVSVMFFSLVNFRLGAPTDNTTNVLATSCFLLENSEAQCFSRQRQTKAGSVSAVCSPILLREQGRRNNVIKVTMGHSKEKLMAQNRMVKRTPLQSFHYPNDLPPVSLSELGNLQAFMFQFCFTHPLMAIRA